MKPVSQINELPKSPYRRVYPAMAKYRLLVPVIDGTLTLEQQAANCFLSQRTLQRWLRQFKVGGLAALDPKIRKDHGQYRRLTNEQQEWAETLLLTKPNFTYVLIHQALLERARRQDQLPPTYTTLYRYFRTLPAALVTLARRGRKAYQDTHELVHLWTATRSNAIWQLDHTQLDIYTLDVSGKRVRPWLTIILDDYSRAICGYVLSTQAPSALQTALALRHAICSKQDSAWPVCGLPDALYTDRGPDLVSDHIEEICLRLHIQVRRTRPRQPRGKGKVERFFGTINQGLLRALPGYSKRSNPDKKDDALLSLEQFEEKLISFFRHTYHPRRHRTTRQAPLERWLENNFLPRQPDSIQELDGLLLTIRKPRQVRATGIQFAGYRYESPDLAEYVGSAVSIRFDPRDLTQIRVYYRDHFITQASCTQLTGQPISLKAITQSRQAVRKKLQQRIQRAEANLCLEPDVPLQSNSFRAGDSGQAPIPYSATEPSLTRKPSLKFYQYER